MLAAVLLAQVLSPQQFYDQTLAHMARLPQPRVAMYEVSVRSEGAEFYVSRDADRRAEFGFSVGEGIGATVNSWPVMVQTRDATTRVLLSDGYVESQTPVMNATWNGVAAWMRYGPQGEVPSATPTPAPLPLPSGERPPVIETVRALGRSIYNVDYTGAGECAGGVPARRFHLSPRDNDAEHPATDVTIDESTLFVCKVRFELRPNAFIERGGHVELFLKRYGPYALIDQSVIEFQSRRAFGNQHIVIAASYGKVTLIAP